MATKDQVMRLLGQALLGSAARAGLDGLQRRAVGHPVLVESVAKRMFEDESPLQKWGGLSTPEKDAWLRRAKSAVAEVVERVFPVRVR